jgi:hypothetical protein
VTLRQDGAEIRSENSQGRDITSLAVTRPASPLVVLATLAALCGTMALGAALRDAVTWDDARELITTLASTLEVAGDRILHGDPYGALKALGGL